MFKFNKRSSMKKKLISTEIYCQKLISQKYKKHNYTCKTIKIYSYNYITIFSKIEEIFTKLFHVHVSIDQV